MARQKGERLKRKLAEKNQEIDALLHDSHIWRHAKKMKERGRTHAMRPIAGGVPAYDPQHPHYDLNGYISKESFSDHETIETEESVVDNFKEAGPS